MKMLCFSVLFFACLGCFSQSFKLLTDSDISEFSFLKSHRCISLSNCLNINYQTIDQLNIGANHGITFDNYTDFKNQLKHFMVFGPQEVVETKKYNYSFGGEVTGTAIGVVGLLLLIIGLSLEETPAIIVGSAMILSGYLVWIGVLPPKR
ncbi:MAG: hypothetical protein R6W78_08820 [Bacteroidales bacterium]